MIEACPDLPPNLKRESGAIIQAFTEFMCAPAPSANVPQWTLYDSPRRAGAKVPYATWLLVKLSFFLKDPRLATRLATRLQAEHRQPAPEQPARVWDTPEDVIHLNLGPARVIDRVPAKVHDQHQSQSNPKTQTRPRGGLQNRAALAK
jgi:hypothetical protein